MRTRTLSSALAALCVASCEPAPEPAPDPVPPPFHREARGVLKECYELNGNLTFWMFAVEAVVRVDAEAASIHEPYVTTASALLRFPDQDNLWVGGLATKIEQSPPEDEVLSFLAVSEAALEESRGIPSYTIGVHLEGLLEDTAPVGTVTVVETGPTFTTCKFQGNQGEQP